MCWWTRWIDTTVSSCKVLKVDARRIKDLFDRLRVSRLIVEDAKYPSRRILRNAVIAIISCILISLGFRINAILNFFLAALPVFTEPVLTDCLIDPTSVFCSVGSYMFCFILSRTMPKFELFAIRTLLTPWIIS